MRLKTFALLVGAFGAGICLRSTRAPKLQNPNGDASNAFGKHSWSASVRRTQRTSLGPAQE